MIVDHRTSDLKPSKLGESLKLLLDRIENKTAQPAPFFQPFELKGEV